MAALPYYQMVTNRADWLVSRRNIRSTLYLGTKLKQQLHPVGSQSTRGALQMWAKLRRQINWFLIESLDAVPAKTSIF